MVILPILSIAALEDRKVLGGSTATRNSKFKIQNSETGFLAVNNDSHISIFPS